jgi:hypothetical protein
MTTRLSFAMLDLPTFLTKKPGTPPGWVSGQTSDGAWAHKLLSWIRGRKLSNVIKMRRGYDESALLAGIIRFA